MSIFLNQERDIYRTKNKEFILLRTTLKRGIPIAFQVETNLCIPYDRNEPGEPWDVAVNALTCMILSHVSAGIDVLSDAYKTGVENTLEQLSERYGDN